MKIFKIVITANTFSDRFSQLPTAFCREVLQRIQPYLNQIGSPKKRKRTQEIVYQILASDASFFHLDKRLIDLFPKIPGSNSVGLKLYLSMTVVGEHLMLNTKIKHARHNDVLEKGRKPKSHKNERCIEVRDRGWFSWPLFCSWIDDARYFISRIKCTFNPQIQHVYSGDSSWEKKKFKDIDWDSYTDQTEVHLLVKPYRCSKGSVYRLKTGETFTISVRGKRRSDGKWSWYLYHLPNADLTFDDIHALYRARWMIEETFREIKSSFDGEKLHLRHPVCIENHLLMMLICYLISRGYLRKIALSHRLTEKGFILDRCMKGESRLLFLSLIELMIENSELTKRELKEESTVFMECCFSEKRSRSKRRSNIGKSFQKLKQSSQSTRDAG